MTNKGQNPVHCDVIKMILVIKSLRMVQGFWLTRLEAWLLGPICGKARPEGVWLSVPSPWERIIRGPGILFENSLGRQNEIRNATFELADNHCRWQRSTFWHFLFYWWFKYESECKVHSLQFERCWSSGRVPESALHMGTETQKNASRTRVDHWGERQSEANWASREMTVRSQLKPLEG